MRAQHTGVVVARGIGLTLILIAVSTAAAGVEFFFPRVSSGWTSYSPSSTSTTATILRDTYSETTMLWFPLLAQVLVGAGLILFSKPVGRWLAMGLKDEAGED